ncbi:hypothetical protein [Mycolicibacterium stellerae]|uniref:hypothetical protein n=1 Tax=Mycolicibacterium stellerae TaxID=2358193 RepID=UPI000F0AF860|nr:hypothetical protein [Mycolicibacterium stellerae]
MTEPRDQNAPDTHQPKASGLALRDEMLRDMSGGESLSLGDIDSIIQYDYSTEPLFSRQSRVISAIASLHADGLLVVGDPGYADEPVESWNLSTEDSLARLRERYVTHYDDFAKWGWSTWFELTPDGERAAAPLKGDTS